VPTRSFRELHIGIRGMIDLFCAHCKFLKEDEMDRQVQRKDKTISSSVLVGEYPIPGMCTCKAQYL
jgi:hypothetical protein